MKGKIMAAVFLTAVALCGCAGRTDMDSGRLPEAAENVQETQAAAGEENTEIETDTGLEPEPESGSQPTLETAVPTKAEVLAMREKLLAGMNGEDVERLTENIKVANLQMEAAYLYEDIFGKLEDKESLYWNYFDQEGEIQIGWAYDGSVQERKDIQEAENLTESEFYNKYGTPVTAYNRFDAENFVELLEEMRETVHSEELQAELQKLVDETELAAQTHEMEHANNIYKLLHDMDYYLLRYGPEDVGKYTQDASVVYTYYGVLSVY